jgi:hypothetical protein
VPTAGLIHGDGTTERRENLARKLAHSGKNTESRRYLGDRLCGLVVRVPGYTTEMYCVSCEVRTEFVEESRPPLWSSDQSSWLHIGDVLCFL